MTEVTPHPLKTQGFHHFFILLFYDHPPKGGNFFKKRKARQDLKARPGLQAAGRGKNSPVGCFLGRGWLVSAWPTKL